MKTIQITRDKLTIIGPNDIKASILIVNVLVSAKECIFKEYVPSDMSKSFAIKEKIHVPLSNISQSVYLNKV